jgi:hypothetical protein
MDETKRPNLQLVQTTRPQPEAEPEAETTMAKATSDEDWIEEIDESSLPPNAWQDEVDSLIRLNHEVFDERRTLLETEPDSIA